MGLAFSNILSVFSFFSTKPFKKILMVGLDGAGKSTILYGMQDTVKNRTGKQQEEERGRTVIPTVGFNVENLTIAGFTLNIWDIGGQEKIQALWEFYAERLSGLIYVIDMEDVSRWGMAISGLKRLIEKSNLETTPGEKRYPVLIFANKKDRVGESELDGVVKKLAEKISRENLFTERSWKMHVCCATEPGVPDILPGMAWLAANAIEPEVIS
jgi:small GTP-binding protein